VAKLEKKVQELEGVTTSVAYAQSDQVNQALPSRKPLLELLTNMNSVVQSSQVVITNIELSPGQIASAGADTTDVPVPLTPVKTGAGDYDELEIEMSAEGTLDQINSFLNSVEKIVPTTTVTKLSLEKQPQKTGQTQQRFEADLALTSYYFTKPVSAAIDAPLPPIGPAEEEVLAKLKTFTYTPLVKQQMIQGGGLEDLFGVTKGTGAESRAN
jgi:hypothetical protein